MSITGLTFNEFCRHLADEERELKAARRRYLKLLREQAKETKPKDEMGAVAVIRA